MTEIQLSSSEALAIVEAFRVSLLGKRNADLDKLVVDIDATIANLEYEARREASANG